MTSWLTKSEYSILFMELGKCYDTGGSCSLNLSPGVFRDITEVGPWYTKAKFDLFCLVLLLNV